MKKTLLCVLCAAVLLLFSSQNTGETDGAGVSVAEEGGEDSSHAQSGIVPDAVKRPDSLLSPLYPSDLSIGELGEGEASHDSYEKTRAVLRDLMRSQTASLSLLPSSTLADLEEKLKVVSARKFRVGGGREEVDGSTSFLFRYIGREDELAGEIYLREDAGKWEVEDIIAEDVKAISAADEREHPYSWLPYDRFY